MEAPLYDLWLSYLSCALKEKLFLRLVILKSKVWWPQKNEKEKKKFSKFVGSYRELNPGHLGEMPDCRPLHYPDIDIKGRIRF